MQANVIAESSCAGALAALLPPLRLILSVARGVLPAQVLALRLFTTSKTESSHAHSEHVAAFSLFGC